MSKNLVIVESPAKAKTIEGFLGKDFVVKSSFGHIRDLPSKKISINIEEGFKPLYEISTDKKKLVKELQTAVKKADIVWLASDEDREGEAISWHLVEALNLEESKTRRIVFHEITKTAIVKAIEEPRNIDINLVNAQQARRVLDRLVGYELSPLLWKKVKPSLSAGRVQSVAVRLIVEKESNINSFNSKSSFKVTAEFIIVDKNAKKYILKAELNKRFKSEEDAKTFLEGCVNGEFSIIDIEKKPGKKSPAPPFITSTLQQEASRKLGFSVSRTMTIAQQLYEKGKITYMRTDSVNLSQFALDSAKEVIGKEFGAEYSKVRHYSTKVKGAQEAHEAIRPTYLKDQKISGNDAQKKLYDLIWKRTLASQMQDAKLERTNVTIGIKNKPELFIAKGEVIIFDGFLKLYLESKDEEDEEIKGVLPPVVVGENILLKEMLAEQKFSAPPARYTEASLVRKLEELGIGRPSTYAPTISTIQKREYVAKGDREGLERELKVIKLKSDKVTSSIKTEKHGSLKGKLVPTDIGTVVTKFLMEYFDNILDYNFTAEVEKQFDAIAEGKMIWNDMLKEFYFPFHKQVVETTKDAKKASGQRLLGVDPKSGLNIYVKIGRFGPLAQIGETESEEKPKFAGLLKSQSIETITFEEVLELFKLPRDAGMFEDKEIVVGLGRFGPYVRHDGKFVSIPKTEDPLAISEESCIALILEKREKDANKFIKDFPEDENVQILNGRWGPYIKIGKKNYKIPKDTEPKSLTLDNCKAIAKEADKHKKKK